jgi:RhoGEF domain
VTTERSYVRRINTLKQSYADPLRSFARTKDTAIIPPYEAKTLFGNIDALIPANEAFLVDLEKMISPNGHRLVGGIGDVALKHVGRFIRASQTQADTSHLHSSKSSKHSIVTGCITRSERKRRVYSSVRC